MLRLERDDWVTLPDENDLVPLDDASIGHADVWKRQAHTTQTGRADSSRASYHLERGTHALSLPNSHAKAG